ncbi:MAG: phenylalanine--tRNA ligase subunit alpha [Spirochaetales bacterium]|nr:phenylalanine--tRNA ligase subunit alpha [Spirochaetales bacterium]
MNIDIKNLHPLEIRALLAESDELSVDLLVDKFDFNIGQCNQAFSWLTAKGFLEEKERKTIISYELTDLGRTHRDNGTPEEQILRLLEGGSHTLPEIAGRLGLENRDIGSAYGILARENLVEMNENKQARLKNKKPSPRMTAIRSVLDKTKTGEILAESDLKGPELEAIQQISKKRGAAASTFKVSEKEEILYSKTGAGKKAAEMIRKAGMTGNEIGALTPDILSSGKWKDASFRPYNIQIPANRVLLGRKNPYCEYIQTVKDKLVSLGFEEFDGPLVETEFWNGDALFMPQFHSARDIHDVYYVKNPDHAKKIDQPYLDQVAAAHENGWNTGSRGWGYSFDRNFTRRQVLRSQGTVLSAKQLTKAKIPGKYFGIVRCFRYDQVDATHGADFYQTEGIVLGEQVNLKTLLGLLKMFAVEVAGAEDVKYVPGYFPFTEPSIEIHIKHPVLGWFELGGSGIFRPEVCKPLGIDVPVLAWGLGIDRMAMMQLGINDMRELFTNDIESVRMRKRS